MIKLKDNKEYEIELLERSKELRILSKKVLKYEKIKELNQKQDEMYKKWCFVRDLNDARGRLK